MATSKSNFDVVYDKMKTDPQFFGQLVTNPEETLKKTGIQFTEGEMAVISLLKKSVVKGQSPAELQDRMTAKGGGHHKSGSGSHSS